MGIRPNKRKKQNITITDGATTLRATLNDTVAAKDFAKRLPLTLSGIDYCCNAATGLSDPLEAQTGWKNGDISLGGGYFALLYGGEEESSAYKNLMIIGHIQEEDLAKAKKLPGRTTLKIALAK